MSAKGARHELVRTELADAFARKLPPGMRCHVELGWRPGGDRYVEPDLMICPASLQPTTLLASAVILIVEVSDSSLSYDRTIKAQLYAEAGVQEYWSVDANSLRTMVHLGPGSGGYRSISEADPASTLTPHAEQLLAIALTSLGIGAI